MKHLAEEYFKSHVEKNKIEGIFKCEVEDVGDGCLRAMMGIRFPHKDKEYGVSENYFFFQQKDLARMEHTLKGMIENFLKKFESKKKKLK